MVKTTTIGNGIKIANIGHGLSGMTNYTLDEQYFESLKAEIDLLPEGTKMLLNLGEPYSDDLGPGNIELIARFFEKYPQYADKTFISVKGGCKPKSYIPDNSPVNLKRSVDTVIGCLRGTKRLDLFEPCRMEGGHSIEQVMETLSGFVEEGKFDYIGLSECSAETLRRAVKIAPVASVEIEVSLWSYEEEARKIIALSKELGISLHAYSPIGKGFLSGAIKSRSDIPEGDYRLTLSRFSEENFSHNLKLVAEVESLAKKRSITPAQLALAWVCSLGEHVVPIPGSSKKERTLENLAASDIELSKKDKEEIENMLLGMDIKGGRYNEMIEKHTKLWG